MTIIHLYTPKGGTGCSTTAALLALTTPGNNILIDHAPHREQPAILGVQTPIDWGETVGLTINVTDQLRLIDAHPDLDLYGRNYDHVFVDHSLHTRNPNTPHDDRHKWWMVIRADYLALRRAVGQPTPDGIIVINEPGRALNTSDIEAVIGAPVIAELPIDPTIARTIDAGLLTSRPPRTTLRNLLQGTSP